MALFDIPDMRVWVFLPVFYVFLVLLCFLLSLEVVAHSWIPQYLGLLSYMSFIYLLPLFLEFVLN